MSTTEDQIVSHLRKLLNDRDEENRKRIADLERDLAHARVKERQMEAEMAHLREQLTTALCALEEQPEIVVTSVVFAEPQAVDRHHEGLPVAVVHEVTPEAG